MITVGVISDTHIPRKAVKLPQALIDGLMDVDRILHAGDISRDFVLYELEEIAPVDAVAGNTDDDYILTMYGRKKIIEIETLRIGLVHGDGSGRSTWERAKAAFADDDVHCIVFGHSHIPFQEVIGDILYFNPGSPTDRRRQEFFSYGILKIDEDKISGEIKYFK